MGRKVKYLNEEEASNAQKRWNMEYYHRNKNIINENMKKRYKQMLVDNPKPGSKDIEMVGLKFGKLTVIEYYGLDKYKNKLWLCKCDCGNETYVKTTYLINGKKMSCGCNQHKTGSEVYNYTGYKDISGTKWNSIESNAKTRNLIFNITKEQVWEMFEKQNKICSLTKLPISFKDGTASIDRINNDKGYEIDNISIVHKDVNIMRNKFSIDYFKKICKLITDNDDN